MLVDLKLYLRNEIEQLVINTKSLFDLLIEKSEQYKNDLLPGYTHLQLAMPSSFGLWFGAYAESLVDDLVTVQSASIGFCCRLWIFLSHQQNNDN